MTTTPYREWTRQRSCIGKRAYTGEGDAEAAATSSAQAYGEPREGWAHYLCPFCERWHIGHKAIQ